MQEKEEKERQAAKQTIVLQKKALSGLMEMRKKINKRTRGCRKKSCQRKKWVEEESAKINGQTKELLKKWVAEDPHSPPMTSTTLKMSSKTLSRTNLSLRDNAFGNEFDEYVSESIRVMPNIFVKPRPPPNTATSQKPPMELAA